MLPALAAEGLVDAVDAFCEYLAFTPEQVERVFKVAQQLGVQLFENSAVTRIDYGPEVKIHTATGSVRAKSLVLGCNAYLKDLNPQLSGKVLPAGSYIIATEPLDALLPANHPLAEGGSVRLEQLAETPFLLYQQIGRASCRERV